MAKRIVMLGIVLTIVTSAHALDLSTEVYSSEDELYEAYLNSEISLQQYEVLRDAILEGVELHQYHILDEIPNLSYFVEGERPLSTVLQTEQLAPFEYKTEIAGRSYGEVRYRYRYGLDQDEPSQYFGSLRVGHDRISAYGALHRAPSGDERVTNRYLQYRNPSGAIREIRVGNYTRRLGMGTVLGHRGKLLNFVERIDDESVLFPDYGGYNGVYTEIRTHGAKVQLLSSYNRDSNHSLSTTAGFVSHSLGSLNTGLIIGVNRLRNRHTDASLNDIKVAIPARYRYKGGYAALETCVQVGYNDGWSGVQLEGRHRFKTAEIKYAGWSYADRYLDLSGGGKTGRSRRVQYLENVDFELSGRRSGHNGGMIKTIVLLTERVQFVNAMLYSAQRRDSSDVQLLSGLLHQHSSQLSYRLDHLVKSRRRAVGAVARSITSHRTRLEIRFTAGQMSLRSYIAYNTSSDRSDFVSLFVRLNYNSQALGRLQVWSNLARYDARNRMVEYWYLFVRSEQPLADGILAAAKMSRSYSRDSSRTQLSLEVKAVW